MTKEELFGVLKDRVFFDGFTDCWHWTGCKLKGYGQVRFEKLWYTHIFAYTQMIGPVPSGLVLDHLCRTPDCFNPAHLEPVTIAENVRRGKGNKNKGKTHCKRGHELVEGNFFRTTQGSRSCLTCYKAYFKVKGASKHETAL